MPITKTNNVITETPIKDADQFLRTGVIEASQFAICDNLDRIKQIVFDPSALSTNTTLTIAAGALTSNATYSLPAASGTFEMVTAEYSAGNSGAALTVNFSNAPNQKTTLTANCTFTFSNPVAGATYLLKLIQDGTGSRTATWPAAVKWPAGTAPTLTTTAAGIDLCTFYYDGTNYFGNSSLAYA